MPTNLLTRRSARPSAAAPERAASAAAWRAAAGSARVPGRRTSQAKAAGRTASPTHLGRPEPARARWRPRRAIRTATSMRERTIWASKGASAQADLGIFSDAPRALPTAPVSRPRSRQFAQPAPRLGRHVSRASARGQRVRHAEYGPGTVIIGSVVGSEELVLVRFDGGRTSRRTCHSRSTASTGESCRLDPHGQPAQTNCRFRASRRCSPACDAAPPLPRGRRAPGRSAFYVGFRHGGPLAGHPGRHGSRR